MWRTVVVFVFTQLLALQLYSPSTSSEYLPHSNLGYVRNINSEKVFVQSTIIISCKILSKISLLEQHKLAIIKQNHFIIVIFALREDDNS